MADNRFFDREFFAIGGIVAAIIVATAAFVAFAIRCENKREAARWAQLYTLTADGRTWHGVHYVQQWRRTITVETQDGKRITVCEPYALEEASP